jgi:hypothetical protein
MPLTLRPTAHSSSGPGWWIEIKHEGFRVICRVIALSVIIRLSVATGPSI